MDLKLRTQQADSVESVTTELADDVSGSREDPAEATRDVFDRMVRSEFDLPTELSDPAAEAVVTEGIDALHDGAIDDAATVFDEAFTTPCAEHAPTDYDMGADHQIACLLYDDRFDETTETFRETGQSAGVDTDVDRGRADD